MALEEAINELQNWNSASFETHFVTFNDALKLAIEALKRLQDLRSSDLRWFDALLPGETK